MNLFRMDFIVELSLSRYILSAMPVYIRPGNFCYSDVISTCFGDRVFQM